MSLKNIFKSKKEKHKEKEIEFNKVVTGKIMSGICSDYDIVGNGRNGIIKVNNKAIDELVELYRANKKDEIIEYCNSLYEEIGINSEYENFIRELCNEIILNVLKVRFFKVRK